MSDDQENAELDADAPIPYVPTEQPEPAISGTFAIYEDGQGGYVLVTDIGGSIERKHIPAKVVKMGSALMGRQLAGLFG